MVKSSLSVGGVPRRAKDVKRLGKDIIVDETSVDGKETHQEDDVATIKYGPKHLRRRNKTQRWQIFIAKRLLLVGANTTKHVLHVYNVYDIMALVVIHKIHVLTIYHNEVS